MIVSVQPDERYPGRSEPLSLLQDSRALLDDFRAGTSDALTTVFNAYVDDIARVVRFGFALDDRSYVYGIADSEEQKDMVQEVFVRAFADKARAAYDGLRPYRPYVLRIAKNLMIDRARKIGRRPKKVEPSVEISIDALIDRDAPLPELEEDIDWKNQRAIARSYIGSLSSELSELVRLRFVECLAQADVARAMGITRRRVRTLEKRALTGLVRLLKREEAM
ncbi:MAG: RNA polymerase sigma factor [Polyangiales bacterium]